MKIKISVLCCAVLLLCILFFLVTAFSGPPQKTKSAPPEVLGAGSVPSKITEQSFFCDDHPDSYTAQDEFSKKLIAKTGTLTYYCQLDPRWANFLCGGQDPLSRYGCGPTALAMLVTSFTNTELTPPQAASWAYANGYYIEGSGSLHSLIPKGAAAFGLKCASMEKPTASKIKESLDKGNILVALMGPGHFTDNGHFIIIYTYSSDTQVYIADPKEPQNCDIPWDIDVILNELNQNAVSGGPMWEISIA